MYHLVIVGGGFAGFWSAMSAVRQARALQVSNQLKITLISKDPYHTIRPRLYEPDLSDVRIMLSDYCEPLGITLIVDEIIDIDTERSQLVLKHQNTRISYHALILATGSQLTTNTTRGENSGFSIDTFEDALKLETHLMRLFQEKNGLASTRHVVVVGGGVTGIELITALPERINAFCDASAKITLHLIDSRKALVEDFSEEARVYILKRLEDCSVVLHMSEQVASVENGQIELSSGKIIESQTIIWTCGLQASPLTKNMNSQRDEHGRVEVDDFLRSKQISNVFVAGDVAKAKVDENHYALMSCQHAIPQGKYAGHNAVSLLFGKVMKAYRQQKYVTCVDLGKESAVFTSGWQRQLEMTGRDAKNLKAQITSRWIYPSEDILQTLEMSEPE